MLNSESIEVRLVRVFFGVGKRIVLTLFFEGGFFEPLPVFAVEVDCYWSHW